MARKAGQGKEEEESRARQQEEKTPACHGRGHHVVEQDRVAGCGPCGNLKITEMGDFMADGLHQLTLSSQSLGFGTPAAPVQVRQHSRPPRSSRTVSTSAQLELCSLPEANCHSGSVPLVCRTCPQVSGSKVSHRRYCLTSCLRPVAMGNILQRSSPEVKNLTQFSLLKGLRNYLPSPVERVLRASASLWPFDNRPWSLRPRSPISNQDAQQELDTTPKSLEYLTINKAKTDLAVQRQLPQPTPKLKCRESHGKPGKNSRGVKIPDSGSGDSRCNHTGAEETTDSQVTSDHIKELSQDKRKGSLSVEVPETMKNTLSRDSMRSAFHPVIRKRPGSSFVPRPEKEKRSLDMSLLLEECVDCCALCSGLAARSSGSRAGDTKPKMRRNDAVPTGTSSSQQRGLVNSPSTQISLKPAPSTKQVLRNSKSVSGDRLTSTLAQGLQRPSKYLEVDFQETEVCLDFKEEYKYVKRFSGSFSSIQDYTKNMDIPNHMKNLNPLKLVRHILDCTLRGDFIADGLDQLTLYSQSLGFGTPAAPV
ncbi:hypothetical protein STEG23_030521 [Scotinomys teguina]